MHELKIKNLTKQFHQIKIFDNLNLDLKQGKISVLLGSSGAGKSTLLQSIAMLQIPDSGTLEYDDKVINFSSYNPNDSDVKYVKSKIGIVFQDYNLWPHMTVMDNLILAPTIVKKAPLESVQQRAISFLRKFEIEDKSNSKPDSLSGGQKQRVAIARALMMDPEVLLFDEPTSALDPTMSSLLVQIIKSLSKNGISIFISTHEINFAKEVADDIYFLSGKSIHESGCVDILDNPKSNELTKFLNNENK